MLSSLSLCLRGARTCVPATAATAVKAGSIRWMSIGAEGYTHYKSLVASVPSPNVLHVELNRPDKANCINDELWAELRDVFRQAAADSHVRCVVLSGRGKNFCAGIDLQLFMGMNSKMTSKDPARIAYKLKGIIKNYQEGFNAIEQCPKPVIAAIHRFCVGAGVDMVTACDIRICSKDSKFSVKEVALGIAADVGTLARLPRVVRADSVVRDWCFTGRDVEAEEALREGLVGRVLDSQDQVMEHAMTMAKQIASHSPIAVQGTKVMLNYGRDHTVADCQDYVATWNMAMLQSMDIPEAATSYMTKQQGKFKDLEWEAPK
eukprot:comp12350_c0_seq1/m.7209 comp12350_c0_seq1/g.7209  ORF comp12350_c0_seq1/g.7209 comp12350_c0_seq1/m.7209 type:complete len:319 (-) comp12350_c0_seq1:184-1140(-)